MSYKALIKSTKGQRAKLLQCHLGVGMILYHHSRQTTCEVEFYVDPHGQLRCIKSGAPLMMEVEGNVGQIRTVIITSQFR